VSIDYSIVTTISGMRFKGDTTYLVTNSVTLSGTTTIEGGVCIKFSNVTNSNRLLITGPIDCQTSPYRPAIFTSKDDDSVGEVISGSTGTPGTNRYAGRALDLNAANTSYDLHDLHFRHPDKAIYISSSSVTCLLSHVQIGYANYALYNTYPNGIARNLLVHDSRYGIYSGTAGTNRLEHVTFHRVDTFRNAGQVYATNCLLICVTNGMTYSGANNATNIDDTGIFQTVGSGARYLASQSTNRNAGTTNINPALLAALKKKTTYPPLVLSNHITTHTTLFPQAQRDTDTPDLGFAYDPLDFVVSQIDITNAALTVAAGTAIGFYGASGTHGLQLLEGATLLAEGTPLYFCRFVRYNLVQEQAGTNWSAASAGWGVVHSSDAAPSAEASFRFTEWSAPPAAVDHVQCGGTSGGTSWFRFRDCSFFNGGVYILAQRVALTNCLLHRSPVVVYGDASETRNCLFVGGSFYVDGTWGTHQVFDTFFDRTYFDTNSWTGTINHYNGYITNENHLAPEGTNNVVVTDMVYQAGPLGLFYQPTTSFLLNTGSVSAASAGLWHFTVTTNQVAETNSVVDLGMHYVALNSQLSLQDDDSDSLANYFEDLDGDGTADSGETDWQTYNSLFGIGSGPGLLVFTPLK
jgi:hypothetical protein